MEYRSLGNTGFKVSALSLGTVSLGVTYGIQVSGDSGVPNAADAVRLLNQAADAGINLFDTAPTYGNSEEIIGRAFSRRPELYIATKVSLPDQKTSKERRETVYASLQRSLKRLGREVLDIVQIHNASCQEIQKGEITEFLTRAQEEGLVRFLGASVYGEEAAEQVTRNIHLDVLQLAYSILDQRPSKSVFGLATGSTTGILVRSALLKGVLSKKSTALPAELEPLRSAVQKVRRELDCSWPELPQLALRFCLSCEHASSVLIGARTCEELQQALAACESGPLPDHFLKAIPSLALHDETLVNPFNWPIP